MSRHWRCQRRGSRRRKWCAGRSLRSDMMQASSVVNPANDRICGRPRTWSPIAGHTRWFEHCNRRRMLSWASTQPKVGREAADYRLLFLLSEPPSVGGELDVWVLRSSTGEDASAPFGLILPVRSASLPTTTNSPNATLEESGSNSIPFDFRTSRRARIVVSFGSERPCSTACRTDNATPAWLASSLCDSPARALAAMNKRWERSMPHRAPVATSTQAWSSVAGPNKDSCPHFCRFWSLSHRLAGCKGGAPSPSPSRPTNRVQDDRATTIVSPG